MNNELTYLKMQDDLVNESQLLTEQADCHSQAMRKILTEKEATLSSLRQELQRVTQERDGLLQGRERAPVVEQVLQEREREHIVRQVTQDKDRRVITPRQDMIQQGRERAPVSGQDVFSQARERAPVNGEDVFPQARERAPVNGEDLFHQARERAPLNGEDLFHQARERTPDDTQEVSNPGFYSSCDQKQEGFQNPREVTPPQPMYDVEISQLQSVLEEKQAHLEEKERQDFVFISRKNNILLKILLFWHRSANCVISRYAYTRYL